MTNFVQNQFYQSISKTVRDIEKKYTIKYAGLLFYNNVLAGHILISPTVFEIKEFEVSKKKLIPNVREILP